MHLIIDKRYGIDAPYVIRNLGIFAIILFGCAYICILVTHAKYPELALTLALLFSLLGLIQLIMLLWMLFSSLCGKLHMRDLIIAHLNLTGHEQVLDVGCGRGLLLIAAAKQLTHGMATGLDLWSQVDLHDNSEARTIALVHAERVADKVILKSGDMRQMPFENMQFDAIISSMSIHNVNTVEGRKLALQEIFRVLKPGGKLVLLDFQYTDEYMQTLQSLNFNFITYSKRYWHMFPPVRVIVCTK